MRQSLLLVIAARVWPLIEELVMLNLFRLHDAWLADALGEASYDTFLHYTSLFAAWLLIYLRISGLVILYRNLSGLRLLLLLKIILAPCLVQIFMPFLKYVRFDH